MGRTKPPKPDSSRSSFAPEARRADAHKERARALRVLRDAAFADADLEVGAAEREADAIAPEARTTRGELPSTSSDATRPWPALRGRTTEKEEAMPQGYPEIMAADGAVLYLAHAHRRLCAARGDAPYLVDALLPRAPPRGDSTDKAADRGHRRGHETAGLATRSRSTPSRTPSLRRCGAGLSEMEAPGTSDG